ncbi:MAG: hypothetical protein KAR21_27425, partial [Spirochaetales bacterium]|nr:hypothetical protein [Spirochaetales bacterium]
LFIFSSCTGFVEPDPSVPVITGIEITGDTTAELAILISWSAAVNSGGYNIYRSEDGGAFTYTGSTGSSQLSYIDADDDLVLGNTYTYKISSYGYWHTKESAMSLISTGIDFFLQPVWENIFTHTSGSPVKIKIALSPANEVYFVYADDTGLLHVGRVIEEEDPDDEDETIFTKEQLEDVSFTPKVDPANPDFDIIFTDDALYIGFADVDESKNMSVLKVTAETDDDDVLTWEYTGFGAVGFTTNPVSSISLAANSGIFTTSGTLYAGSISNTQLQIWERPLDASSGTVWEDISPLSTTGTPEYTKIFMDGSNLSAAYNNDSSDLDILSRSSSDTWPEYDSLPLTFSPTGEHFSTEIAGSQLSVFSFESGNTWNIQTRDDDEWIIQDNDSGFDTVSSGLTSPFSSAVTASNMYLMAVTSSGPEVLTYDRDVEKWFAYGNPGGSGSVSSPQLVVSTGAGTENYYAAWIEGSTAHISVGR